MDKKFGPVWVIAEQNEGVIEVVSLQLLGKARQLADELNTACEAVIMGDGTEPGARALLAAGADRVFVAQSPALDIYQPALYTDIVCSLALEHQPDIMLIGSTFMGRELAPLVAARLKTGLAAHCTGLELDDEGCLKQQVPAYGGLMSILCPEKRPQMATVARGVFKAPEPDGARGGEIVAVRVSDDADPPVRTLEIVKKPPAGIALEDSCVVVSGGAGAGGPEGWEMMHELAKALNAAIGCTRPVVDEGLAPQDTMIGQSGKMICPQVYIGVGLSGEQQHMVGITGARLMAAINCDPKSPVFNQVDIGIVEDCRDFLPVLIAKIKAFCLEKLKGDDSSGQRVPTAG